MTVNNPAGRLHKILTSAHAASADLDRLNVHQAWAKLFNLKEGDELRLALAIARIGELSSDVKKAIKSIDGIDPTLYLTWVNDLAKVLKDPGLNRSFREITGAASPNVMSLIAICSDQLAQLAPENVVDTNRLDSLRKQITELKDQVLHDEELALHLKNYILHYIDLIEQAITDYQMFGIYVFQAGVERAVGHYAMTISTFAKVEKTRHGSGLRVALAALVISCISAYPSAKELAGDIRKLLPGVSMEEELPSPEK